MGTSQSKTEEFKRNLKRKLTRIYPSPKTQVIQTASRKPIKLAPQNFQRVKLDAKPVEETNELKVNAFDGRTQILTTAKWPYSVHGLLAMRFKKTICYGTGIMIGPDIVLTAGHNLYSYKTKTFADLGRMQFLPGMNGQVLPFGEIEVKKYFVSPNYIKEEKEDYGILILKERVGERTGHFGLACLEPEEIKKKKINITGYPGDKVASKSNTYEMWGMEGEASHVDKDRGLISYLIDTDPGQSGSGVWYQDGEDFYVCGVHALGTYFVNKATLITRAIYQQIYMWIEQVSFNDFIFQLGNSRRLNFENQEVDAECLSILIKYNLGDLQILDLSYNEIGDKASKVLTQNTSWINLSQLDLSWNQIGAEGIRALAQNASWTNLSQLNLYSNNVGPEGAKALAQNISWINLSQLNLQLNSIGAEGAKALAQNTSWIKLSQFSLRENKIGAEGVKALAQNTSWVNISKLDLSWNNLTAEGAKALAQNTSWINLSQLDLSKNDIRAKGVRALVQNVSWTNLLQLGLSYNTIGAEGAKALVQNTSWINLSELDLRANQIGVEGTKALAQNAFWTNLSQLDLRANNIGAEGAKALAQNTSWSNLSKLDLSDNTIGAAGASALAQNTSWINLLQLDLSLNKINAEGAQALAQNTSWINLSHLDLDGNHISFEESNWLRQNKIWNNINIEGIYPQ